MSYKVFEQNWKEYEEWFEKNKFVYESEILALKKVVPRGIGLEVGVGTGRFAKPLNVKIGLDPSINMLKIAKTRGIEVVRGMGEKLPFVSEIFDYVLLIVTLCFVSDPNPVIEEARRVVKKKGYLIIAIIDKNSFLGKIYSTKKSKFYEVAKFYSAKEVIEIMQLHKFSVDEIYQTVFNEVEKINEVEEPKTGYGEGAFVVIRGIKV